METLSHLVEAVDEVVEFVARAAQWNLYRDIRAGDVLCGTRDGIDGLDRYAGQPPSEKAGQHQHDRSPQEVGAREILHRPIGNRERAPDGEKILVLVIVL